MIIKAPRCSCHDMALPVFPMQVANCLQRKESWWHSVQAVAYACYRCTRRLTVRDPLEAHVKAREKTV